jgi:hypothetical protein
MLPEREYESMRETLYLMASPANRERISRAIAQLEGGEGQIRELTDADEDRELRSPSPMKGGRTTFIAVRGPEDPQAS